MVLVSAITGCWLRPIISGMAEQVFEIIDAMRALHVPELLAVVAGVLILVDYFFPTDWPAHVGYVAFSGSMFFVAYMYGLAPVWSLVVAGITWLVLCYLHRVLFRRYLENAPGTPGYEGDQPEEPNPSETSQPSGE